jgi:ABC-type proline/glycine betaine transport system permease subunit
MQRFMARLRLVARATMAWRAGRSGIGDFERGQTTAEYALVIVGAAALAALVLVWATSTDAVGRLFNAVLDNVLNQFK